MSVVERPTIPYWGTIPGAGLEIGSLVVITGRVLPNAKRFEANFAVGGLITMDVIKRADLALHFNVRFDQACVVRNSRQKGVWGPEERKVDGHAVPFVQGKVFTLMFLVEQTEIKVAVDGKHFVSFKHRLPFTSVKIFNFEGDIEVEKIEYKREPRYSGGGDASSFHPPIGLGIPGSTPIFNPPLPLNHPIPGGVRPGMMIYFSGKPSVNFHRFNIDLVKSGGRGQNITNADVALHFNPRFEERLVVRNSFANGQWGDEERSSTHFPFAPGVNFDMIIRVEGNRFLIAINGQHYTEMYHRILPLNTIDYLRVEGDLCLASIRFSNA
jgi:hypothetical protein